MTGIWCYGEGTPETGVGHLVRLAALAEALGGASLVTRDMSGSLHGWAWAGRPHRVIVAPSASAAVAVLRADLPGALPVLDHYALAGEAVAGAVVLDDVPGRDLSAAGLVVSTAPDADPERYPAPMIGGLPYALVRAAFRPGGAHDGGALLMLGGTDHRGLLPAFARALRAGGMAVDVVVATATPASDGLAALPGVRLHVGLDAAALADLMRRSHVGVVAASSVALEAAACGLPLVAVQTAGNQAALAAGLAARGVPLCPADTPETVGSLLAQAAVPAGCDGAGAQRVAERIRGLLAAQALTGTHQLRAATWPDAERLFAWANDAQTRASSLRAEPIPWPDHLAWLRGSLLAPERRLFVVEAHGAPLGTVRLDRVGEEATVSLTVAPGARGRGHGRAFLALLTAWTERAGFARRLVAWVRDDNPASLALFRAAGYLEVARGTPHGHAASRHHLDLPLTETP